MQRTTQTTCQPGQPVVAAPVLARRLPPVVAQVSLDAWSATDAVGVRMALGDLAVQLSATPLPCQLHPSRRNILNTNLIQIASGEVQLGYLLKAQVGCVTDALKGLKFGSDTAHLS